MGSKYQFYVEQLQDPVYNPLGTIQFYLNPSVKENLCFAMTNDFTLSASAEWAPAFAFEEKLDKLQGQAATTIGMGASVLGELFESDTLRKFGQLDGFANRRIKPLMLSYLSWIRSSTSPFQFNLYRFAVRPKDNVIKPFKRLFRCVLPTAKNNIILETPLGYSPPYPNAAKTTIKPFITAIGKALKGDIKGALKAGSSYNADGEIPGTVTVRIGTWCTIRGLLVNSFSFTASKFCTKFGNPLYASGTISLIPYRMLVTNDIDSMFKHNSSEPTIDDTAKPLW